MLLLAAEVFQLCSSPCGGAGGPGFCWCHSVKSGAPVQLTLRETPLLKLSPVGISESVVLLALARPWTPAQLSMVVQAGGWAAKP